MQNVSEVCANCRAEAKCRRRDFSEQAWTVLVVWNEIQTRAVDQPLCDDCYDELRDTLIDRADEIEAAMRQTHDPKTPAQPGKRPAAAGGSKSKVRKAS